MADKTPHTPCPPGALKRSFGPHENWIDEQGGLPRYFERIACHVHFDHGYPISEAIAIAVADAEKMCSTGESNFGHIHAAPQSEACEAVAHWEAMRAAAHAKDAKSKKGGGK
jgi:hypothetical protein